MPKRMTPETEQRLLGSIEKMCQHVQAGQSPTEAAHLAAKEAGHGPDMVRMMCNAYNIGAVTANRKNSGSALEKFATISLADAEQAVSRLYPSVQAERAQKEAGVVDPCYSRPPRPPRRMPVLVKSAAEQSTIKLSQKQPDKVERMYNIRREVEQLRTKAGQTKLRLEVSLCKLADAVGEPPEIYAQSRRRLKSDRLEEFDWVCQNYLGDVLGKKVADFVAERVPGNRASERTKLAGLLDWNAPPYSLLKECRQLLYQLAEEESAYELRKLAAEQELDEIRGVKVSRRHPILGCEMPPKQSSLAHSLMGVSSAKNILEPFVRQPEGPPSGERLLQLTDPAHEDELRRIRARAMLHDLLANDEIISGYSDQDVVGAYNELSQLAPRVAEQKPLVRSILRRWLPAGQLDTFEGGNLVDIEKGLQATHPAVVPSGATTWSPLAARKV